MERNWTLAILAFLAGLGLSGCSGGDGEELVTFESVKFRRNAAHEAFVGTVGLAREEGATRYELKYTPYLNGLVLRNTTTEDSELRRVLKDQLGARFHALRAKRGSPDQPSAAQGHLYLLRVADINSLVEELNADNNQRYRDLMSGDSNYRIVTSVIIDFGQKADTELRAASSLRFELHSDDRGHAYIDVKKDDDTLAGLTMSEGTVIAYEYGRLCWKAGNGAGGPGPEVGDIILDRAVGGGDDYECPQGMKTEL